MSFVKAQICIAAVMIVAACGARTGLEAPDVPDAADAVATADASDGAPVSCTPGAISLTAAQPEVMFVLDRSGSMSQKFSGNSSRWASLTAALAATLPPVDATMAIGALIFPRGSANDDCVVPGAPNLAPAVGNVNALVELMSTEKPGGATPTADAISTAASLLSQLRAASTARALVLATDGAPNCNATLDVSTCTCAGGGNQCHHDANDCLDEQRTVARIAGVLQNGIPTYVIGIADDSGTFAEVLDAMAIAGGRPLQNGTTSYYPARSPSDLDAALGAIRDQVGACTFLTTSVPNSGGSISLTLDGIPLPFVEDASVGWTWVDESNGEISLDSSTCALVAEDAGAHALVANVTCADE